MLSDLEDLIQSHRKSLPVERLNARRNDIYITNRHPIIVYYKRALSLFRDQGFTDIYLHALGSAIIKAVWVTQDLVTNFHPLIELEITTRTNYAVDLENNKTKKRPVSGITIKLTLDIKTHEMGLK